MLVVHSFIVVTFASHINAFLHAQCNAFKRERIDPLVAPGVESNHMHTFFGSDAISPTSRTSASLRRGCTSCQNSLDKSAYWIPTLYYVTPTSRTPVEVRFRAYYQGQYDAVSPFPEDFAMIVGNPTLDLSTATPEDLAPINWYCRDGPRQKKPAYELPSEPCPGWANGNIDRIAGNVVYDTSIRRHRACKSDTEPGCFRVPGMFFSVSYQLGEYKFLKGEYLELATGGGHTYHADFIMGWDKSALDALSHNNTPDVKIGAPQSYTPVASCASSNSQYALEKMDQDTRGPVRLGTAKGTVPGTYGHALTITDGRSIGGVMG